MPTKQQLDVRTKGTAVRGARPKDGAAELRRRRANPAALVARARTDARSLSPRDVLQLQSALGNRAVASLLAGSRPHEPARPATETVGGGLPDGLRTGIESLSGVSLEGVRVHHNSSEPTRLNALAYTRGNEIHLAPGQEQHLAHEAWHVVQQRQGRVQPTLRVEGLTVNDDSGLEREADLMSGRAVASARPAEGLAERGGGAAARSSGGGVVQLFSNPPVNPPNPGVRGHALNADQVPVESHVTTRDGQANNLVGTAPGAIIHGWNYIQAVGAAGAWVRFHLINQQIGGRGDQANLVPTSHATNHQADWRNFERTCQYHEGQQTSMHVTVDVRYPAAAAHAVAGTLQANRHFYPDRIRGRCYLWDAVANAYQLPPNGAPANRNTFDVTINPFPLQPPANANITNLSQQTAGWLRNTLMAGNITLLEAQTLLSGLQGGHMGQDVQDYIQMSNEPTPEMELLDAIESFLAVEVQAAAPLPANARTQILNGSYRL